MGGWPSVVLRAIAVLNIGFAGLGLALFATQISEHGAYIRVFGEDAYAINAYYAFVVAGTVCLVALFLSGTLIWRNQPRARLVSSIVFSLEILYSLAPALILMVLPNSGGILSPISNGVAKASGVGVTGIAPQFLVGYPIWGLVLLNIAYRKQRGGQPRAVLF